MLHFSIVLFKEFKPALKLCLKKKHKKVFLNNFHVFRVIMHAKEYRRLKLRKTLLTTPCTSGHCYFRDSTRHIDSVGQHYLKMMLSQQLTGLVCMQLTTKNKFYSNFRSQRSHPSQPQSNLNLTNFNLKQLAKILR